MSNLGCFMSIFNLFTHLSRRYSKMSSDERAQTGYFGLYSIITSIVGGGLFVLGMWGILLLIPMIDESGLGVFVIVTLIIILALIELVLLAELVIGGLLGIIYQARCNIRPVFWVAIAVLVATVAAMIVGLIFIVRSTGLQL